MPFPFAFFALLAAAQPARAQAADSASAEPVAPGVTHARFVRFAGPFIVNVLTVDLTNTQLDLRHVRAFDRLRGRERTMAMVARVESGGESVLVAVNTDFFDLTTGENENSQVIDGEWWKGVAVTDSPADATGKVHSQFALDATRRPLIELKVVSRTSPRTRPLALLTGGWPRLVRDGLNFDGGGSTTMVVRDRIVNSPSDSAGERAVGDALLVVRRGPSQAVPVLDSARLIADISALAADSMEGRRIGTPGGARARTFLLREYGRIGLAPVRDSFPAPFYARVRTDVLDGVNLVGMISGTKHADRYLVVSAHYDHLGVRNGEIYNGADDNASGTAAVLAMARWFKAHPPENSVIFALFDGEEEGLLGAKAFLDRPPVPLSQIVADVNLDMVSRNVKGELYASGATPWPVMKPLLDSVVAIAPVKLLLGHDTGVGENNWIQQSDQGPFHTRKIPFVYFGVEDHPDYHKPGDKIAHIEPGFYYRCVQTIAEFTRRLDLALDRVAPVRARGR